MSTGQPIETLHQLARRLGVLSLTLLALTAAAPGSFSGCSGGPPPGTLPASDASTCVRDTDCAAEACQDVRCLAGVCELVAESVDRDGDGQSPSPCGLDCDDSRPDTFDGAVELCDARDNDCNGLVDDGAPVRAQRFTMPFRGPLSVVVPLADRFLVIDTTPSAIFGRTLAPDGELGPATELMRLAMGGAFARLDAAAADDGRVLLIARTDIGAIRYVVLEAGGVGDISVATEPRSLELGAPVLELMVVPYRGAWALAADVAVGEETRRRLYPTLDSAPTVDLPFVDVMGLAAAGDALVMTVSSDSFAFFAGPTVALDSEMSLSTRSLAATPRTGLALATRGFAPATRELRLNVHRALPDGTLELASSFPDRSATWSLFPAGERIVLVGAETYMLDADLVSEERVNFGVTSERDRVSVAENDGAIAICVANTDQNTVFVWNACGRR